MYKKIYSSLVILALWVIISNSCFALDNTSQELVALKEKIIQLETMQNSYSNSIQFFSIFIAIVIFGIGSVSYLFTTHGLKKMLKESHDVLEKTKEFQYNTEVIVWDILNTLINTEIDNTQAAHNNKDYYRLIIALLRAILFELRAIEIAKPDTYSFKTNLEFICKNQINQLIYDKKTILDNLILKDYQPEYGKIITHNLDIITSYDILKRLSIEIDELTNIKKELQKKFSDYDLQCLRTNKIK